MKQERADPVVNADVKTLEILAEQIQQDADHLRALNYHTLASIADIIRKAIGAPVAWPSRVAGAIRADVTYPGSPSHRMAFNAGVKWAVERYAATDKIDLRFAPEPREAGQ